MRRARAMTPPPSPRRVAGLVAASLLLVAVTGTFTYARFRNDAARRRVEAACDVIERGEAADRKALLEDSARLVAGNNDADTIASLEKATRTSRVCEPLAAQLSGYKWNFGRYWAAPPVDPAALPSREKLAAMGARAKSRCVARVGMFLELGRGAASQEVRQELFDLCDLEKQGEKALNNAGAAAPMRLLDEWPAELERLARGVAPAPQPASSSIE